MQDSCPDKKRHRELASCLSKCTTREVMCSHKRMAASHQPRGETSGGTCRASTSVSDLSAPELRATHFCCVSSLACGASLWQPEQTEPGPLLSSAATVPCPFSCHRLPRVPSRSLCSALKPWPQGPLALTSITLWQACQPVP